MFKATVTLIAVLTLCLGASMASALIVAQDNLESYSTGSPPGGDWSFATSGTETHDVALDGGNQVLDLTISPSGGTYQTAFWAPYGAIFGSNPGGALQWQFELNTDVATTEYMGMQNGTGPYLTLTYSGTPGIETLSTGVGTTASASVATGTWYTITMWFPGSIAAGGPVDYYVGPTLLGSAGTTLLGSGTFTGASGYNPNFQIFNYPAVTGTQDIMVDNVKFATELTDVIPEPASLGLLAVGGLLLLKRRSV